MKAFNKRSFLKFFGLTLGSLAASSWFKSESSKNVKLVYRIDFPAPMATVKLKDKLPPFFNKEVSQQILRDLNCKGKLQKEIIHTATFYQKTLTFPDRESLDRYLQEIKQRKNVLNHNALIDAGYRVYFKIVT